ncbi:MAG TPA: GDP-mannose 4,6-dehydratase [Candidatus Hydrogenedentes bacterium]|nr:GDP-mannose 4,6-dehydratase [Candidatus Hydrogenedentota bacterium]HPC16326.1 GDP-mannose 4,6-dehydratase [Candidatus Hydrogenedentota bacterium]HRT20756.1 GDP-mannose 4,6-dehydratase [Candidatus Hydrogenedentota bacterium]HRT66758.1 GDP-mannose 4,6-dehydratase [Candidatus Hydrogenedentota bacterium]
MDWQGRKVLVTGGGGFVGSHLVERLLSLGARVRATVHGDENYHLGFLGVARGQWPDRLEVRGGDIRDAAFVRACAADMDTVFHLAAVTSVAYSYTHPEETIATCVMGTLNVCEAAREANVRRMIYTSSAGVYGDAEGGAPITEDHPVRGCNPYTAGKLGGDFVAETYHRSYDLPVATVRLFNAYGPRMGRYLIMPTIIQQALRNPVIRLGDLTPTRNFTFVEDIVTAFVRMAEEDAAIGQVVHFGSPATVSMGDLARKIFAIMGRDVRIETDASRLRPGKSEIRQVIADCTKARNLLQWEPRVTLDEGLARTIEWIAAGGYEKETTGHRS